MTIGKRISELRKQKKLSQETLAEELNVSRQAVSKWENDLTIPDMENLLALAQLLGVQPEYLIYGTEPQQKTEQRPEPSQKPKKDWTKRILCFLLVCAIVFGAYYCYRWHEDAVHVMEMEQMCTFYAGECLDYFLDYMESGDERFYWYAVADYRVFMECFWQLVDDTNLDVDYVDLNEVYAYLVSKPELSRQCLDHVMAFLEQYQQDLYDVNAGTAVRRCRNALHQAD